MTSRSEYRLLLRQDNADRRLTPIGYRLGLVPEERMQAVREKYEAVDREIRRLEHTGIPGSEGLNRLLAERGSAPVTDGARLIDLLRRPQMTYRELMTFDPGAPALPVEVAEQVEISVKYEGYIRRQEKQVEELRQLEKHRLPPDMEYSHIQGLRLEAREKLAAVRPLDLGQASRISGVSPADIAALRTRRDALTVRAEQLQRQISTCDARLEQNRAARTAIDTRRQQHAAVRARWQWVHALAATANGAVPGKEKIMLETYIQTAYFDRILGRANTRLLIMSGGQYELRRCARAGDNRSQTGLELEVIDHYNGTARSVKTLSGGETFAASLSLALGLSDEVQATAGGVQLEAMFVDEGFGSLDSEALQQALAALVGVSGGSRIVGIISHVAELKDRIDRQIIVTKDRSGGSRVQVQA